MKPALLLVSIVFLMGGCTSDDPNQGGLIGGLIGLGSGSYEQRVADKTASWNSDEQRYQEEVASKNKLDAAVRDRHVQVTDLELQVAEIEGDIAALDAEIEALQSEEAITSDKLTEAEGKIASLLGDIDALSADQETARLLDAETLDTEAGSGADAVQESNRTVELRAYIAELAEMVEALNSARESNLEEASHESPAVQE